MINIRCKTVEIVSEFGPSKEAIELLFDMGLISDKSAIKWLIRHEYETRLKRMMKTDLKILLSEKYCVSYSTIEKYVLEEPAIM